MRWKLAVVFVVGVALAGAFIVRRQQLSRYTADELDLSGQQPQLPAESQSSPDWSAPAGQYCLTVAMDRSGSITSQERAVGDQIVQAVSDSVQGSNILQVAAFANAFETFGSADTEEGRKEVLARWKRAIQYTPDIQKTNLTVTADNLVRDAIPNIKAGRLAEITIITDGDHDPPEGQYDDEIIASVQANLDAIPEQYRDRLRIHVIEVGNKFKFAGAVARDIFGGRATTIRASTWSAVLPIVLKLQNDLIGRFCLKLPDDWVDIGVPDAGKPKILGPFDSELIGPESAGIRFELISDTPDAGEQLLSSVRVNLGEWVRLPAEVRLKHNDRLEFSFHENPAERLPDFWFSAFGREYKITAAPGENLMALANESGKLYVRLGRDSIAWRWLWTEIIIAFFLFIMLVKRILTVRRRNRQRDEEPEEDEEELPMVQVRYQGRIHVLVPAETIVGQITFLLERGVVSIRPDSIVLVEYNDPETYSNRQFTVAGGETFALPAMTEVAITDDSHEQYQLTYTREEVAV